MATKRTIKRLIIPEKPSVSREIINTLKRLDNTQVTNESTARRDGFYSLSNGDVVCHVFGHMLQMVPPSRYFSKEQNANPLDHLPLIPDPFRFEPIPERTRSGQVRKQGNKPVVAHQFKVLERLIKQAQTIVNACDIDREGQLIFDELLQYVGRNPHADDVLRVRIVSYEDKAMEKAMRELEPNGSSQWRLRGIAAATRQKMDWLLGMNSSMAYQVVTGVRTMSVGRVQTPILAMVVRRDLEIENFVSKDYFVPVIIMSDGTRLRWEKRQGAESEPGFDANGRIIDRALAQAIVDKIRSGQSGEVTIAKQEERSQPPPLPFSMDSLQSTASRELGLSVSSVTKAAQNLYERHKAITYVGTNCQFLPEEMHENAPDVLRQLGASFAQQVQGANEHIKSRAFNDKKVGEHFAIIPTGTLPRLSEKDRAERGVFNLIVKRYLAQFYPNSRSLNATLAIEFERDEFRATASQELEAGWRALDRIRQTDKTPPQGANTDQSTNRQERHT